MLKMGWFGLLGCYSRSMEMALFDRAHASFYRLSNFHGSYFLILHRLWDWSKFADFNPSHMYLAPSSGATPSQFLREFLQQKTKTRVPNLSYGVGCVILNLDILIQYRLVTNRRRDTEAAISITPTRTTLCWLQWLRQAVTQHKVRRTIILVRWTTSMEPTAVVHTLRSYYEQF